MFEISTRFWIKVICLSTGVFVIGIFVLGCCVFGSPRRLVVEIMPNDRVVVNGRAVDFSKLKSFVEILHAKYHDPLKRIRVFYSGGESYTCEAVLNIMVIFSCAGFNMEGVILDGVEYKICAGESYDPAEAWHNKLPDESIIITALSSNYQFRVVGNLADEDCAEEKAERSAWIKGENLNRNTSPSFDFVGFRRGLSEKLNEKIMAVEIKCLMSVKYGKLLDILRICRDHNVEFVFMKFWCEKELDIDCNSGQWGQEKNRVNLENKK